MDRHTCKLCFRRFSNGRALGGHMRSHIASATMGIAKPQLQDFSPSASSSSSASQGEQEAAEHEAEVADQVGAEVEAAGAGEAKQLTNYGLRENPRKSYRLVDPEFSSTFAAVEFGAGAGSSVVLQDRESETESSKPPPLRRRSSRRRRGAPQLPLPKTEASFEPEPVSSVSDTTPEEDVARCLMMLSRDVWTTTDSSTAAAKRRRTHRGEVVAEEEADDEGEGEQQFDDGSEEERAAVVRSRRGGRRRYQCGTCGKVFRSYQALGGHRASHKNARACVVAPPAGVPTPATHVEVIFEEEREKFEHGHGHLGHRIRDADSEVNAFPSTGSADRRVHECPVCFRVFGSGQALGGHKRSHLAYSSSTTNPSLPVSSSSNAAATNDIAATTTAAAAAAAAGVGASPVGTNFTKKFAGESLIDLNLPAPMDEEVEMSAVFDAEQ